MNASITDSLFQETTKERSRSHTPTRPNGAKLSGPAQPATPAKGLVKPVEQTHYLRFLVAKRIFDVVFATLALLCLAPLFLVVAILIKLESKGPVFYYSYRVGMGYRVFKFWKFRSMRPDADKLLASMKGLNQYQAAAEQEAPYLSPLCPICRTEGMSCRQQLIDSKGQVICESQHQLAKKVEAEAAFVKIANDPRVTRIGKFIRNTSIDELPQLFNVLWGDMSIVGNRPLPLYEAEKITTDEFAARFMAPAGITGLWQVSKRGNKDMSAEERKLLDVEYAKSYSFLKDLKIVFKTVPALFQKENV